MKRERTLRDDLVWAIAVLAGFGIGALIFGADVSILVGGAIGVSIVVIVRAIRRRRRR